MGWTTPRGETSAVEAAFETFRMEQEAGHDFQTSLRYAVASAVETANRATVAAIRDSVMQRALAIDEDDDNDYNDDGPAALIAYAKYLDELLPPELRWEIK